MLRTVVAAGAILLALQAAVSSAIAAELHLTISNVAPDEGQLMVQVLADAAALDGKVPPVAAFILPASADRVRLSTTALAPGTYGIRVMHDRNGNGKLDSNALGIPREPWGFSNNATGNFGPPGWEAISFELQDATTQDIRLRN